MNRNRIIYEGKISNLVSDSLLNWIGQGSADELDYRIWFSKRLNFYKNKIVNVILKRKPKTNIEAIELVQKAVDFIKENHYERGKENNTNTVDNNGNHSVDCNVSD